MKILEKVRRKYGALGERRIRHDSSMCTIIFKKSRQKLSAASNSISSDAKSWSSVSKHVANKKSSLKYNGGRQTDRMTREKYIIDYDVMID